MQYEFCYLLPFDLWTFYLKMIFFLIIQGYSTTNSRSFLNSTRTLTGNNKGFLVWWGLFNKIIAIKGNLIGNNKEKHASLLFVHVLQGSPNIQGLL